MLTTTCIFQRIALLIGWAKDQAGRIGNILENGNKRSVSMNEPPLKKFSEENN